MKKNPFTWILVAVMTVSVVAPSLANKDTDSIARGAQIFQQRCASCHAGGGNSVNAKRPLAGSKQLAHLATLKAYLSAPPGHMPYYQDVVENPELLQALYKYCKTLKKQPLKHALNDPISGQKVADRGAPSITLSKQSL
jgi:mono/diheme cytochrome c family protein